MVPVCVCVWCGMLCLLFVVMLCVLLCIRAYWCACACCSGYGVFFVCYSLFVCGVGSGVFTGVCVL